MLNGQEGLNLVLMERQFCRSVSQMVKFSVLPQPLDNNNKVEVGGFQLKAFVLENMRNLSVFIRKHAESYWRRMHRLKNVSLLPSISLISAWYLASAPWQWNCRRSGVSCASVEESSILVQVFFTAKLLILRRVTAFPVSLDLARHLLLVDDLLLLTNLAF